MWFSVMSKSAVSRQSTSSHSCDVLIVVNVVPGAAVKLLDAFVKSVMAFSSHAHRTPGVRARRSVMFHVRFVNTP
jgi:hypothetical protein